MGAGAYLLGALLTLAGLASLGVSAFRLADRLLPGISGSARWSGAIVLGAAAALVLALVLGTFGLLRVWLYLPLLIAIAAAVSLRPRSAAGTGLERATARGYRPVAGAELERSGAVRSGPKPGIDIEPVEDALPADGRSRFRSKAGNGPPFIQAAIALGVASAVVGLFAVEVWQKLGTGMTGFDSTWYHGPFSAGFLQTGDTFSLHFVAPQFLSWFYPQNSELVHTVAMLGFDNDLLSPLVNLGWLAGCLVAAWAIGRPYGGSAISLAGVALVLGSAAMADQAGEARNDIVGILFLLAGIAVLVATASGRRQLDPGPLIVIAVAAGLAAGTKINFVPAAFVLAFGAAYLAGEGQRKRSTGLALAGLALGGGYWYLRNLIQSGNPLPWIDRLGLPSPDQELGGRDAASVLSYLTDPSVISDWFLPGLADAFSQGWPLLVALALTGIVLGLWKDSDPARRVGALVALALALAWIAAPTSASGPTGEPAGFESGLRYLAPALAVAMAVLGAAIGRRDRMLGWTALGAMVLLAPFVLLGGRSWGLLELFAGLFASAALFAVLFAALALTRRERGAALLRSKPAVAAGVAVVAFVVLAGLVVQSRYFDNRYASPEFTTPGLSEAFVWARGVEGEEIGTNATRQYPLFGTELTNEVQYLGVPGPHGGFVKVDSCEQFRDAVARGDYRYLVLTLDRENPERPFPREIPWIEDDPNAVEVLRTSPTVVYELTGTLDPDTCP
jgi:hypothetical protein